MFEQLYSKMIDHAREEYPKEACGIVFNNDYIPMKNIAQNPLNDFRIDAKELLKYPDYQAVYHSHPDAAAEPSAADIQGQIVTDVPWILSSINSDGESTKPFEWGANTVIPALIGREFRHGPSGSDGRGDCYALIKDYYKLERNVDLPEFPRNNDWWNHGESLYIDHFKEAGFKEVDEADIKDGDVFLMSINSNTPNHGGIILDGNLILHHLTGRQSRREPLGRWIKYIDRWLRYGG